MSKQTKLETETSVFKTIEAYKQAATEAGLVLDLGEGSDSRDLPDGAYTLLKYIRRVDSISSEKDKIIRSMHRQIIEQKEKGKPSTKKEFLTYDGKFMATNHRGMEYGAEFSIGKYQRPKIVLNPNQKYNPDTGLPLHDEKILSGAETVYDIELPTDKKARKALIDSIIAEARGTYPENINYYYKDTFAGTRDSTFSYEEFTGLSIDELRDTSKRGGGAKSSGIWRDKDGVIRDKDGNPLPTIGSK